MSKAQLKKQKIREETERLNSIRKLLSQADSVEDYLADLPIFRKFKKNELNVDVRTFQHCPEEYKDWVFDLTSRNMREIYEKTWGWNDSNKRAELFSEFSHYLIGFDNETPMGFVHFRFEPIEFNTCIYLYELQVEPKYQRNGFGKFMMQAIEMIALKKGMDLIMLTVLKENIDARRFYTRMHYDLHSSSPSIAVPEEDHEYHHEIRYKSLMKK